MRYRCPKDALGGLVLAPLHLRSCRLAETRGDMAETAFEGGRPHHPGWAFHGIVIGPAGEAAPALHRLLRSDWLAPASRAALIDRHPIGGAVEGRPRLTTGYGLGLMIGTMGSGTPRPLEVIGHSAGGPGSVGAVCHAPGNGRTVAVLAAGTSRGAGRDCRSGASHPGAESRSSACSSPRM